VTDTERAHLEAVRASAYALVLTIDDALAEPVQVDPNAPCTHPEELRVPLGTMGNPYRFLCGVCKELIDG
jgi:hypothetical protein